MLLWLADYLSQFYSPFSVVQYLTLRGIFSVMTALAICMVAGPLLLFAALNHLQMGQAIRSDGPPESFKQGGHANHGWRADF